MHRADITVEGKIERQAVKRRLFDGAEARLGQIAKYDAGGGNRGRGRSCRDGKREKILVIERRKIEAEPAEIVRQENGAANFGVDGFAEGVGKSQPEGQRRELIVIGDESPAAGQQGFDFEALLFAPLRVAGTVGIPEPAVLDAKIGISDRSIFERLGAK